MSKTNVHAIGTRRIGGAKVTACNSYMATGFYAVDVTENEADVTCGHCLKALAKSKPDAAVSFPTREDCPTCWSRRDKDHNRMPIGFCHPTKCLMAKERAKHLAIPRGCSVEGCHQPVYVSGGVRCEAHALRHQRFARGKGYEA